MMLAGSKETHSNHSFRLRVHQTPIHNSRTSHISAKTTECTCTCGTAAENRTAALPPTFRTLSGIAAAALPPTPNTSRDCRLHTAPYGGTAAFTPRPTHRTLSGTAAYTPHPTHRALSGTATYRFFLSHHTTRLRVSSHPYFYATLRGDNYRAPAKVLVLASVSKLSRAAATPRP